MERHAHRHVVEGHLTRRRRPADEAAHLVEQLGRVLKMPYRTEADALVAGFRIEIRACGRIEHVYTPRNART